MSNPSQPCSSTHPVVQTALGGIFIGGGITMALAGVAQSLPAMRVANDPRPIFVGLLLLIGLAIALILIGIALIPSEEAECPEPAQQGDGFFARVKEFFTDLQEEAAAPPATEPVDDAEELVDIDRLPPNLAAAVRPFFPAGERQVHPKRLQEALIEATRLMAERERFTRQQAITIDWACERDLAQSRAAYLASLNVAERAGLQMRIRAQAEAHARAAFDWKYLEEEIAILKRQLADAEEDLSAARSRAARSDR